LSGEDYNASSDIWSVAVMVIELWSKRYPFLDSCSSPIHLSEKILEIQRNGFESIIPDSCSAAMESFLLQTLAADPIQKMKGG
jgi:serine/threonine protein kinase